MKTIKWLYNDTYIVIEHSIFNIRLKINGKTLENVPKMGFFDVYWRYDYNHNGNIISWMIFSNKFNYTYTVCINSIPIKEIEQTTNINIIVEKKTEKNVENTTILNKKESKSIRNNYYSGDASNI